MKTFAAALVFLLGYASAGGKPELSFTVKDGTAGGLTSAIAPKLSYSGNYGGVDIGASLDSDFSKSVFVEKNTQVEGWNLRTHAEYTEGKYDYHGEGGRGVYLTVEAKNQDEDLFAWCSGAVCLEEAKPLKIGAKRIFEMDAGKFMVEPRYSFENKIPDVCLGFETQDEDSDTRVYLTASREDQNVKVIHKSDKTTGSIKAGTRSGFMRASLEQENDSMGGTVKVAVTPDDLDLELKQDGWTAGVNLAMDGLSLESEPKIRFSKKISFST